MHSRKAFSNIQSLEEARLKTIMWVVESMTSFHYNKMVFFKEIFSAVQKPYQWPAFGFQAEEVKRKLMLMDSYQRRCITVEKNRGATFIAQSVTRQRRVRSYVARDHPKWLFEFFVNESRSSNSCSKVVVDVGLIVVCFAHFQGCCRVCCRFVKHCIFISNEIQKEKKKLNDGQFQSVPYIFVTNDIT